MQPIDGYRAKLFTAAVSLTGVSVFVYSTYRLSVDSVRLDWMLLLVLTVLLTSRAEVFISKERGNFILTDAFIYVSALIMGPWATAAISSIDGVARSLGRPRRMATIGVNLAAKNLAALSASLLAAAFFGPLDRLVFDGNRLDEFMLALGVIALTHRVVSAGIIGEGMASWQGLIPVGKGWGDYSWSPVPFLMGMLAAGLISKAIAVFGFYSLLISVPILLLTYAIYKTYMEKMETSNQHIERLTRLHLATIESLTMAIDAKDQMARGHIQRVRTLAEGLARAIGYPEDQIEGLKTAALLHDIGKLAVPEHILNKPGKLSKAEYSKMMNHPVVGADILSNVEFPYEVVPIVKHHHEKFDGTGYPSRLKGEEIPLGARILTVVDCYDALITDRPYRPCYKKEEALELMRTESGRTFDPLILEKFFRVIASIECHLPAISDSSILPKDVGSNLTTGSLFERLAERKPKSRTEEALRDIAAAQREVPSLYEISQTLGSTLKLSEVLPIVAAKLEKIANFTTLVIYLSKGSKLKAAQVIGRNAEALKNLSLILGEGGAGWVASHRQILIGGSPLADLERSLGREAAQYHSTAIFPLLHADVLVGALALYSQEDRGYSADEVRLLETISSHAATAIYNALVFERTQESALTDNLTGLPNSRYLYSFFDQERSRAERHNYPLVLMMMDLDGFKKVNDTYGHHVGDDILRCIAESLRAHLRTDDTLIRYAGDEFVAVLHRATADVVMDLKTRLQSALDEFAHEVRPGRMARVGISIGYATYGEDGTAIEELMEVADHRMYEDKQARRRNASSLRLASPKANSINF